MKNGTMVPFVAKKKGIKKEQKRNILGEPWFGK